MSWFFIAIFAPLLWSLTNQIDKILLSKYTEGDNGVGALIIYSSIFAVFTLPVLFFMNPNVLDILVVDMLVLVAIGALGVVAIILYLYSMDRDEATAVVPFLQLIPVVAFFLGYFILGEVLTKNQIIASALIMCGAVVLSLEFNIESKTKIKKGIFFMMFASSFIYALCAVLYKAVTVHESNFWVSMFWEGVGVFLAGLILFVCVKKYRFDFYEFLKGHNFSIFSLNVFSESATVIGNLLASYAVLIAPVALVLLMNAYQPVFVFIEGVLLTIFLPKIATEKITGIHLAQKVVAIGVIFVGSLMLY
jgi:drug/metabolite transporter (DMT)-like permease